MNGHTLTISRRNTALSSTLIFTVYTILFASPVQVLADTDPQLSDSPVTASIPLATPTPTNVPTTDTTAPYIPILVSPTDGTYTSDNTPTLSWLKTSDPNSNYVVYTIYLNGVATYLGVSNNGNSAGTGYTAMIVDGQLRLTPNSSLNDGLYSWKVVAQDASNNQSSSTNWSFVVDTVQPFITISNLGPYQNPTILENSNFEIQGPDTVAVSFHSEPYTAIQLTILKTDGQVYATLTGTTDGSGNLTLSPYLNLGFYRVQVSATDPGNLTTLLPLFSLTLQKEVVIPSPTATITPTAPPTSRLPAPLTDLPATVSQVTSRYGISLIATSLLALASIILLALLKKRRNLLLTDVNGVPLANAHITYNNQTYTLTPRDHGYLYLPGLQAPRQLTITYGSQSLSLCIARSAKSYKLVIG